MTEPYRTLFVVLVGTWLGALLFGMLALRLLVRRLGRDAAWPLVREACPLLDLVGTWAGAAAAVALALGRVDYGFAWAGALFLVALMVTVALYDRAVLMPSLDASFKRLAGAAGDAAKWEDEWRFLWRMAGWGRLVTLVMGAAAIACGLAA